MRSRGTLFSILFAVGLFVVPQVTHAAIPFFGPIIPDAFNVCPPGWGMIITVINNIISLLITLAIVFVAPLMIAWSGFLFVVNPVNAAGKEQAKGILTNTIIGIVIALASWMIVDAIMAVLYNPTNPSETWSSLITSGGVSACLPQKGARHGDRFNPDRTVTGVGAGGGSVTPSGKTLAQCSGGNTVCSPAVLQNAGFNETQANVMSCIAMTESSGNPITCNGNACGLFQIMLTANQLVGPACSKYNNGNPVINCPALCKAANGGAVKNEASCKPCADASLDAACNAQSAQNLVAKSGYTPWTCTNCNSKAKSCIQQYGG
jgi:hypothetical protein